MKTIKESQLKELFNEVGLDENIFDIFKRKKKKLKARVKGIESYVDDVIDSAPTDKQKDALIKLRAALEAL